MDTIETSFLVDTDANAGLGVIAINLAQAVDEYGASMFTAPPPVYPGVHMHALSAILPVSKVIVFTFTLTQVVQAWLPRAGLYVFTAHCSHMPPFGPVYPATHSQSVIASLYTGEILSAGHVLHALCPTSSA